jgi:predicted RNase H-like HicB family nuclease
MTIGVTAMTLTVEYEQEAGGDWTAAIVELPGVQANGETAEEAGAALEITAMRTLQESGRLSNTVKFIHKSPEVEAVFQDASRLPATYRAGRGSDYDIADGLEGVVTVDSRTNPEDRYE